MAAVPPICDFGWKAVDFELDGVDGKRHGLSEIRGSKGTLVIFICNHCPYVKSVIGRIVRDARDLAPLGVGVIGINSNDPESYPEDSFEKMKSFARTHGIDLPYAVDRTQEMARAYEAVCTPDFFGFNSDLELQYRGRLDESKTTLVADAQRELFQAMTRIVETGRGPEAQISSMGCSIKWREP